VPSGAWILYEVENGVWRLTGPSKNLIVKEKRRPIEKYLDAQGRFSHLTHETIRILSEQIDEQWKELSGKINKQ